MAGNTGKMTREQIKQRGPRMVLARYLGTNNLLIFKEGEEELIALVGQYAVLAKSYSRSYLERIAEANK